MANKESIMIEGLCFRAKCFNKGMRCSKGYCTACCRAFHDHTAPSSRPSGVTIVSSNVSLAIQPEPAPAYTPGEIRLVCTQDIIAGR